MIYRVAIQNMGGYSEEEFFSDKQTAENRFNAVIEEKKKAPETLNDEECEDQYQQDKNFTEANVNIQLRNKGIRVLREVYWSYGNTQSNENGSEFYAYTDEIILEEIELKGVRN